ncbi:MAG: alpha/beta fold hydrolase [Gammaproteobacteria bacterium]
MPRFTAFVLLALLPSLAFAASPQGSQKAVGNSCLMLSASLLHNLENGDFTAATTHFDNRMKAGLGAQKLKEFWQKYLPQQHGTFQHAATPKAIHQGSLNVVVTPLKFADGWENWVASCNDETQIDGVHIHPGMAPNEATAQAPASASAWITKAAVNAKTLPIAVQRDGFILKGVLDLPTGKGPFPVVTLIPGSGPVNINGNGHSSHGDIAYSPYKKLAAVLVKAGWAVARVAKRGLPPSTGDGNKMIFGDQVADNLAIVEALRKNPHINPHRIVALGHSLGGLIAPKLATETRLAGLILLEAPGESMKEIFNAQAIEMAQHAGASATTIRSISKEQKKAYRLIDKAQPGQAVTIQFKKGKRTFSVDQVALFRSWLAQKPLVTANKVKIPVLVVQGGLDFNVPPGNGKRLVKALPHGKLLYLPKMGHALDIAPCRCLKQLDTGKDATLAPGLTEGIVRWLKQFGS